MRAGLHHSPFSACVAVGICRGGHIIGAGVAYFLDFINVEGLWGRMELDGGREKRRRMRFVFVEQNGFGNEEC